MSGGASSLSASNISAMNELMSQNNRLSGGLQPMNMLNAYRQGASWDQLNAMNPVTQRPAQFLPPAMPQFDYMAQHQAQQMQTKPAPVAAPVNNYAYITDGGGAGDGGVGDSGGGGGGGK